MPNEWPNCYEIAPFFFVGGGHSAQMLRQFRENAAYAKFPMQQAETVVAMVAEFEALPSLDRLMAALSRAAP